MEVGVLGGDGSFTSVLTLPYSRYNRQAYERRGGLVDVSLDPSQASQLLGGRLAFRANVRKASGESGSTEPRDLVVLAEHPWLANTDQRGIYTDPAAGRQSLQVGVTRGEKGNGHAAPKGTRVLVVKYGCGNFTIDVVTSRAREQYVTIVDANGHDIQQEVEFRGKDSSGNPVHGKTLAAVVETDDRGIADVHFEPHDAGFPMLLFLPYGEGEAQPTPGGTVDFETAGFAQIRIWPRDESIRSDFVTTWNNAVRDGHDVRQASWAFVWEQILYLYDMLYPVMLKFMPLGDLERIEGAADQLEAVLQDEYEAESTVFMPITRDLSSNRRWVLKKWVALMRRGYPKEPISAGD